MKNYTITCPECGHEIKISKEQCESVVNEIRNQEFAAEVEKQVGMRVDLAVATARRELEKIHEEEKRTGNEKYTELRSKLVEHIHKLEVANATLTERIEHQDATVDMAVAEAVRDQEREIARLNSMIAQLQTAVEVRNSEIAKEKAVSEAKRESERNLFEEKMSSCRREYEAMLEEKDRHHAAQMDELRKQYVQRSTKQVGEDLEQYVEVVWSRYSLLLPRMKFEKINKTSISGIKADFGVTECTEDGYQFFSMAIEVKNQDPDHNKATKVKAKDHLAKLNKYANDMNSKYRVLVVNYTDDSFEGGLLDVSNMDYGYPNTYIVSPQCLMALLLMLRNQEYKLMLLERKNSGQEKESHIEDIIKDVDFSTQMFENIITKAGENEDYISAAIAGLNKVIKTLEKMRKNQETITRNAENGHDITISVRENLAKVGGITEDDEDDEVFGDSVSEDSGVVSFLTDTWNIEDEIPFN